MGKIQPVNYVTSNKCFYLGLTISAIYKKCHQLLRKRDHRSKLNIRILSALDEVSVDYHPKPREERSMSIQPGVTQSSTLYLIRF